MSSRDNNGSSRNRSVLTHWVPLAVTVAIATAGVAAWAWSQRQRDDEDEDHDGLDYGGVDHQQGRGRGPGGATAPGPSDAGAASRDMKTGVVDDHTDPGGATWSARIGGALRRTPSPQQVFGSASKTVAAGVAAAGAAVGTALSAIREEDKTAYADHETWSEEADAKHEKDATGSQAKGSSKKRKTVAVVVSADSNVDELGDDDFEHATILSHLPKHIDYSKTKLFILIYAPGLKDTGADTTGNNQAPSLSSSFSNIGHEQAQPTEGSKSPALNPSSGNPAFNSVYSHALSLVEKETMVLPFTTRNGHVHILRHLQPEIVYLQESLSGDNGSVVTQIQTWLRYELVLVVGAESGHGGLADSESEAETKGKEEKWWQREDRVGRGRGVVVVDSMRVSDDWAKRVQGFD